MRFAKQKFLIVLLMASLPFAGAVALLQNTVVSGILLQAALKIVRFRTGLRIEAESWNVNPFSFSASLEKISLVTGKIDVRAPELSVQLSPLGLILGTLRLRELRLQGAVISGELPESVFEAKGGKDNKDFTKDDLPTWVGENIGAFSARLKSKGISFEELSLKAFRSQLKNLQIGRGTLQVANLEAGQARLDWSLEQIVIPGRLSPLQNFSGSIALVKESKKQYLLALRSLQVDWPDQGHSAFQASGHWPGEITASARLQLETINKWLMQSSWLKKQAFTRGLGGRVEISAELSSTRSRLKRIAGKVNATRLQIEEYLPNDVTAEFESDLKAWKIPTVTVSLPRVAADRADFKSRVHLSNVTVADNKINGQLALEEATLCGILVATDTPECLLTVGFTGGGAFEGDLKPFEIRTRPSFKVSEGVVYTDSVISKGTKDSKLLSFKAARLDGDVSVRAKEIYINRAHLAWPDGSEIDTRGKVIYHPTIVDLDAVSKNLNFENALHELLDLRVQGKSQINANIHYSELMPQEKGRTRVLARLSAEDAGVEKQRLGQLSGPMNYIGNVFKIGPLKLRNGGGQATIAGLLEGRGDRGSYLDIGGKFDRLEVDFRGVEADSQILHAFASGGARIQGYTNSKREGFLSGPIDLQMEGVRSFGIPFPSATAKARYANRILYLDSVRGKKSKGYLDLKGELNPDGGTKIEFQTEPIEIQDIGFFPRIEQRFQNGFLKAQGFWKAATGWEVKGVFSQIKIAGSDLSSGSLRLAGDGKTFLAKGEFGKDLSFNYEADSRGKHMRPVSLKSHLKDSGIYSLIAYLKDWASTPQVSTRGELDLEWTPRSGSFRMKDLEIEGPQGSGSGRRPLLVAKGSHEIAWSGSEIIKDNFDVTGPTRLKIFSRAGRIGVEAKVPLVLIGLFTPSNVQIFNGEAELSGSLPSPPDYAEFRGQGQVRDGALLVKALGQSMTGLNTRFEFAKGQFVFSDARAAMGSGEVTLAGAYKLDLYQSAVLLNMHLNRARAVITGDVPLEATGDLTLKGDEEPYLLTGKVQVANGVYSKEFKEDNQWMPITEQKPKIRFNLDVEVGSEFYFRNSLASTPINGRFNVTGTDLKPLIRGVVEMGHGSIFAKDTEFKILQGRVTFGEDTEAMPLLNLQASTTVKYLTQNYKVDLYARGPVDGLNIEFTSDPSMPQKDIISLLAFGIVRAQEDPAATQASANYVDTVRAEALQAVFGKAIGPNLYKSTGFQVRVSASPDISEKGTVTKLTVGRKISDRMYATFGRSIDPGKDEQNAQLDYRLFQNVNLSGIYERPDRQESSVGVDLKFRFDVK